MYLNNSLNIKINVNTLIMRAAIQSEIFEKFKF